MLFTSQLTSLSFSSHLSRHTWGPPHPESTKLLYPSQPFSLLPSARHGALALSSATLLGKATSCHITRTLSDTHKARRYSLVVTLPKLKPDSTYTNTGFAT